MPALEIMMPPDQNGAVEIKRFSSVTGALDIALRQGGLPVIMGAGGQPAHYYQIEQFMGGWLLDGCPLNVIQGGQWTSAQIEAVRAAGIQPRCPQGGPPQAAAPPAASVPSPPTDGLLDPDAPMPAAPATTIQRSPTSTTAPGMPSSFSPTVSVTTSGGSPAPGAPPLDAPSGVGDTLLQYWPLALAGVAILAGFKRGR